MRFFTNENKDDDAKDVDVKERGQHDAGAESADTVALPQQRGNSPWSSTPDTADGTGSHRRDDEPLIEDPTPPDHAAADTSPDATAAVPAGEFPADADTHRASDSPHDADARRDADGTGWAGPTGAPAHDEDAALKDDGGFDDPKVAGADDAVTDGKGATLQDDDTADGKGATLRDDGGFDDPRAVDPATDEPIKESPLDAANARDRAGDPDPADDDDTPLVVADPIPVETVPADETDARRTEPPVADAKPGEVPAPEVTTIFGADDAKAFQDRWRDVQLRFVDSPKEATAEAAALVDDAVERLTASLRGQKDAFRGDDSTEDTERLRVELRGYREIFNRIIGL